MTVATTEAEEPTDSSPPHLEDRYRGRQDERTGNRIGPEHAEQATPTPTPLAPQS
jgi:hypothetical protein